jgi:hypothetical protein
MGDDIIFESRAGECDYLLTPGGDERPWRLQYSDGSSSPRLAFDIRHTHYNISRGKAELVVWRAPPLRRRRTLSSETHPTDACRKDGGEISLSHVKTLVPSYIGTTPRERSPNCQMYAATATVCSTLPVTGRKPCGMGLESSSTCSTFQKNIRQDSQDGSGVIQTSKSIPGDWAGHRHSGTPPFTELTIVRVEPLTGDLRLPTASSE